MICKQSGAIVGKRASAVSVLASHRHPIRPEIAEFGTARNCSSRRQPQIRMHQFRRFQQQCDGSPCSNIKIESKSWRSGGGLSGEIGLKRSGLLRFRPRPSFETAVFAGSKSCPPRSSPATAEPARSIGNHLIRVEPRKS